MAEQTELRKALKTVRYLAVMTASKMVVYLAGLRVPMILMALERELLIHQLQRQ
jgi:hypothetical protein